MPQNSDCRKDYSVTLKDENCRGPSKLEDPLRARNSYETRVEVADGGLDASNAQAKNYIADDLNAQDLSDMLYVDKRRYRRFRPLDERRIEIEHRRSLMNLKARVVNISSGGILLECDLQINREAFQDAFKLKISDILGQESRPLQLIGRAVRCSQGKGGFRLALSFEEELAEEVWDGLSRVTRLIPA